MSPMKAKDLQYGDIVRTFDGAYSAATVIKIDANQVTLFRPYVHTSRMITTGGLIPYLGHEKYSLDINSTFEVELLERQPEGTYV